MWRPRLFERTERPRGMTAGSMDPIREVSRRLPRRCRPRWCEMLTRCSRGTRSASGAAPTPATGSPPARPTGRRRCASPSAAMSGCWRGGRRNRHSPPSSAWRTIPPRWPGSRSARSSAAKPRARPRCSSTASAAEIGISLTDRAGWAVCTVGAVDELGCDLELVEPRSERSCVTSSLLVNRPRSPTRRSTRHGTRSPTSSGRPRRAR